MEIIHGQNNIVYFENGLNILRFAYTFIISYLWYYNAKANILSDFRQRLGYCKDRNEFK